MADVLTEREVQAMIALWAQRRDPSSAGPTVADVAEALEISLAEAEALAWEVSKSTPAYVPPPPSALATRRAERERGAGTLGPGMFAGRLALASLGLTGLFCAYLDKVLA